MEWPIVPRPRRPGKARRIVAPNMDGTTLRKPLCGPFSAPMIAMVPRSCSTFCGLAPPWRGQQRSNGPEHGL
jgi:hypothetical protein